MIRNIEIEKNKFTFTAIKVLFFKKCRFGKVLASNRFLLVKKKL